MFSGNVDGVLKFATEVDSSGFQKFGGIAKKGLAGITKAVGLVGAGLTTMGGAAIKVGSEFEAGMSQVAATMGMTAEQINNGDAAFEKLKAAAKEMGATTQFSATQASEALNYLALAGFDADKSVALLPKSLALAAAGGMELGRATDMITDSMSALGISVEQADGFIDEMARTSQKSNTSVAQLGEGILKVGATAKDLAGGTNELNTALGLLANVGFKGAEGGTKLRNIIMAMTPTTDAATIAFEKLGVETYDFAGNLRGLNQIMFQMSVAMDGLSQEEKTRIMSSIFNKQDLAAASGLMAQCSQDIDYIGIALEEMGAKIPKEDLQYLLHCFDDFYDKADFVDTTMQNFGWTLEQAEFAYESLSAAFSDRTAWDTLSENIENSKGAAEEMAKVMNDNLKGDITILQSALEGLGISMYENLSGNARGVVQTLTEMVDELNKAAQGGLEPFVQKVGEVFASLATKVAEQAPALIDSAVQVIASFLQGINENAEQVGSSASSIISSLANGIITLVPLLLETAGTLILEFAKGLADKAPTLVEKAAELIVKLVEGLSNNVDKVVDVAIKLITTLAKALIDNLPKLIEAAAKLVAGLLKALITNAPKLLGAGVKLVAQIVIGLIKAIPEIAKAGLELIKGLWQGIVGALSWLKDKIVGVAKSIVGWFKEKLGIHSPSKVMAEEIGEPIIDGVNEGMQNKKDELNETVDELATGMVETMEEATSPFDEIGSELVDKLKTGVDDKKSELDQSTKSLAESSKNNITETWKDAQTWGETTVNNINNGIKNKSETVKTSAKVMALDSMNNIRAEWQNANTVGAKMAEDTKTGIDEKAGEVKTTSEKMAKEATGAIKTEFQQSESIGASLTDGLWSGIKSKMGSLMDKIKGFGRSITNKLKDVMGIRSPSQIFRDEIGKNLALGLGVGFNDEFETVADKMQNAVSKTTHEMTLNVAGVDGVSFDALKRTSVEHSGKIRVEGVNNRGELLDVVEILKDEMRREARI